LLFSFRLLSDLSKRKPIRGVIGSTPMSVDSLLSRDSCLGEIRPYLYKNPSRCTLPALVTCSPFGVQNALGCTARAGAQSRRVHSHSMLMRCVRCGCRHVGQIWEARGLKYKTKMSKAHCLIFLNKKFKYNSNIIVFKQIFS
jgi:hypothetical protein